MSDFPIEKRTDWTLYDDFLLENYIKLGAKKCGEILNLPASRIQSRATKKLGIKCFSHKRWTEEEDKILHEFYSNYGGGVKCAELLGRSIYAIGKRAQALGINCIACAEYVNHSTGYKVVTIDGKKITEHRYVMEQFLGRKLLSSEIVHHINGDKLDNCIENLILTNRADHINEHREELVSGQRKKYNS